jgi:hypothetical protein
LAQELLKDLPTAQESDQPFRMESNMSIGRKMLLETLIGHLDLLESAHPRRASSPLARKTRRYVKMSLRRDTTGKRAG